MKGMYVMSETADMMRQRKRHERASACPNVRRQQQRAQRCQSNDSERTVLDLRVVQRDRLLRVRPADAPRLWYAPEGRDPPQREEDEADEEYPCMHR